MNCLKWNTPSISFILIPIRHCSTDSTDSALSGHSPSWLLSRLLLQWNPQPIDRNNRGLCHCCCCCCCSVSCFQRIPPLFFECHESLDICGTYYLPILLVSLFLMASLEIATQSRRTNFAYQRYWEAIGAPTSLLAIQRGNINGFMAENQNPDLNMGQYGIRPLW